MTPDEIKTHPLFQKLNERQQIFVSELMANGREKIAAAHKAWTCSGDESARTLANRALDNPNVKYLVDEYFGADPTKLQFSRDSALAFAAEKARTSTDEKIALDYFRLVAMMNGWLVKAADKPEAAPVDDSNDPFTL